MAHEDKNRRQPDAATEPWKQMAAVVRDHIATVGLDKFLEQVKKAPKPPLQAEWFEVAGSLETETSDRAMAIVAAAFLDDVLRELIKRRLANDDQAAFKKSIPPPGNFARCIDLAASIGLLGRGEAADLRVINGIRNRFAHRAISLTFEDSDITGKCNSLLVLNNMTADGEPIDASKWPARDRFRVAVFSLTSYLQMLIPTVERLDPKRDGGWPFGSPLDHVDRWSSESGSSPPSAP